MSTFYQTEAADFFDSDESAKTIRTHCQQAIYQFRSILRNYLLFHLSFAILLLFELLCMSYPLFYHPRSLTMAFFIAGLLLTIFSYAIFVQYFQGKKTEQFRIIKEQFFSRLQRKLPPDLSPLDEHLMIANAAFQLTTFLYQQETYSLSLPPFRFSRKTMLSIGFFLNCKDVQRLQEILLSVAIQEHVKLIKIEPTNLAVHTSLANTFIALSKIYQIPDHISHHHSFLARYFLEKEAIVDKFSFSCGRAIEELKVIDELAPNDPWVHAQLASCYHHLKMQEEEMREYEVLLNLCPDDKDILLRLGVIYFEMGKITRGLRIYEKVSRLDSKVAAQLISYYDVFVKDTLYKEQFSPI